MKKAWKQKEGSALLIAMIIMMALTMLGLALLLVSFTLFSTVNNQKTMEQCKELAQSVSKELEEEISGSETGFASYQDMEAALDAGKCPLWFYLRCNLWQTSWPYYNSEERGHTSAYAYRYFKLNGEGTESQSIADDISVKMYWDSESGAEKSTETNFVIEVTCQIGKQKSVIATHYTLSIDINPIGYGQAGEKIIENDTCNPDRNTIQTNEKWTFSLSERE